MTALPRVRKHTTSQLFIAAAERWADRVRWQVPGESGWIPITWRAYSEQVYATAAAWHARGYAYPGKIGILAPNSLEWITCALGCMLANCVLVPIYAGNTAAQSSFIITHSDMQVLVVESRDTLERLQAAGLAARRLKLVVVINGEVPGRRFPWEVVRLDELRRNGAEHQARHPGLIQTLARRARLDDIATLIYTSGTTGNPKGVPLSHRNLGASTQDWLTVNGSLIPEHVLDIHWLPNAHIYGWGAVGLGNIFGFESYLGSPFNVLELLPVLKPHVFLSVPAYYEKLYVLATTGTRGRRQQLEKLRTLTGGRLQFLLSGGAGLRREVKEFFLEAGLWITEGYGLSECSPTLTMNRREAFRFDSVGLPFPSVKLKLAADGEILARGANVFSGYYKNAAATRTAFTRDGWFKTGDVGEWLEGGFLRIVDRKRDLIVTTGGKNIAPQNIERRFQGDPFIAHLVVYGDNRKYLVAVISLHRPAVEAWARQHHLKLPEGARLAESAAVRRLVQSRVEHVNATLASYETVKKFIIAGEPFTAENGLLTAALKIRRRAVYTRYQEALDRLYRESLPTEAYQTG